MRTIVLALLVAGCGEVHFVEPNPPRLFQHRAGFTALSVSEPLVWVAVINLFIQEASECAWARQTALAAVRNAIGSAAAQQIELPAQDLSPDCRQRFETPLDVESLRSALLAARAAFPGAHVRPLVVYVDDVDLELPGSVLSAFANARNFTAPPALLWAVSLDTVAHQLGADRQIAWQYAGDPTLPTRLGDAALAELPLQTTAALTSGPVPLLDATQLEVTKELRVCTVPPEAMPDSYPARQTTHLVDPGNPPTITFQLPQQTAQPKSLFVKPVFEVLVEGCTANCERYFIRSAGSDPYRWDQLGYCALGNR
jgi:hypothetical protein